MKTLINSLLAPALLALVACTSAPTITPEQISATDVGPVPGDAEHAKIAAALDLLLKDPRSAEFKWGTPHKDALRTSGRIDAGWEIPVMINAKNGMGGYTGFKQWSFFLINGRIASYQDPRMAKLDLWTSVKQP